MENSTKALLISAAVLIAIILISLGVSLLGSAGDTAKDAQTVGQEIADMGQDIGLSLSSSINENMNPYTFYNQLKDAYTGIQSGARVQRMWNLLKQYNPNHDHSKPHISCAVGDVKDTGSGIIIDSNATYRIQFSGGLSIYIYKVN